MQTHTHTHDSIPQLLLNSFGSPTGGPLLSAYITAENTVFLFAAVSVAYGLVRFQTPSRACCVAFFASDHMTDRGPDASSAQN